MLRGNDSNQYDKYASQFFSRSDDVQALLESAILRAKQLGLDTSDLEQVKEDHADLNADYGLAIASFNQDDELTGKKVDRMVKGVDRPASRGMSQIANDTEARFKSIVEDTIQNMETDYLAIKSQNEEIMLTCSVAR